MHIPVTLYHSYFHVLPTPHHHVFLSVFSSIAVNLPKCGKGKPALIRRNTVEDKNEIIACIESRNFAKAARIAAGRYPHLYTLN